MEHRISKKTMQELFLFTCPSFDNHEGCIFSPGGGKLYATNGHAVTWRECPVWMDGFSFRVPPYRKDLKAWNVSKVDKYFFVNGIIAGERTLPRIDEAVSEMTTEWERVSMNINGVALLKGYRPPVHGYRITAKDGKRWAYYWENTIVMGTMK